MKSRAKVQAKVWHKLPFQQQSRGVCFVFVARQQIYNKEKKTILFQKLISESVQKTVTGVFNRAALQSGVQLRFGA